MRLLLYDGFPPQAIGAEVLRTLRYWQIANNKLNKLMLETRCINGMLVLIVHALLS